MSGPERLIARLEASRHAMRQMQSASREAEGNSYGMGQAAATYGETADALQAAIDWLSQPATEDESMSREQAENRIASIRRDQAWQARWLAGGADEKSEWSRLTRIAGGDR